MTKTDELKQQYGLSDRVYVNFSEDAFLSDESDLEAAEWEHGEVVGVYELVAVKRVTHKTSLEDA